VLQLLRHRRFRFKCPNSIRVSGLTAAPVAAPSLGGGMSVLILAAASVVLLLALGGVR
jgi:hypothetical protein